MIPAVLTHHVVHRELTFLTHPAVLLVTHTHQLVQQAPTHHAVLTDLARLAALLARLLRHMVPTDHTAHTVHTLLMLTVAHAAPFLTAHVVQLVTENGLTSGNKMLTGGFDRLRLATRCPEQV